MSEQRPITNEQHGGLLVLDIVKGIEGPNNPDSLGSKIISKTENELRARLDIKLRQVLLMSSSFEETVNACVELAEFYDLSPDTLDTIINEIYKEEIEALDG